MIQNLKQTLFIFVFIIGSAEAARAQNTTANQVLNKVYTQLQKAKDYKVNANIKVDLPFIKMLPINATIYVKQPNKFKVTSKSIAVVPRQGFDQLNKILSDSNQFTAIIQANELVGKVSTQLISLIPLGETDDLILAKLWVDIKQNLILKSVLTTKSNGTILTEYSYGTYANYGLPSAMIFTVDIKKFKIPKAIVADINTNTQQQNDKDKKSKKGKIIITLLDYSVNKGIDDKLFTK